MAAKAPDYDVMADEDAAEDADTEEVEDAATEDASDDDEFMMHAEEAGFTGEKAKALWRAVARCTELTQGGGLPIVEEEEALV